MTKKLTFLIAAAVMLLTMMATTGEMWGQSDYSTTYTSGVTLSTAGGTSASTCKVIVTGTTEYDGIKAGTSKVAGAMKVTVPSGTKYLHIHVAAWNGETVTLSVTPNTNISSSSISLTADSGVSGSGSTYTLGTSANASTNYYKVITFTNALTADTDLTFTATSGKRFVIWGVNAEEDGGGSDPSITAANVNIAYNATNGSIEYSIENGSGNVTASITTGGDWLTSLGTITASEVPFNCSANEGVMARTATVTLSFTGASNKVVTITQAGNPNAQGGANNPYTVAQARAAIDAGTGTQGVYATGIVYQVDSYNSTYHSITYWISDDGTSTNPLEVYGGLGIDDNTHQFTSKDDIQVNDIVVVCGNLTKYNSTYEFAQNNRLISLVRKVAAPTFYPAAGAVAQNTEITISCATNGATIYYTTDGTDPSTGSTQYNAQSKPTVTSATTIKAIAVKDGYTDSDVASAEYTILVPAETPTFLPEAGTYTWAQNVTISTTTEGAIIYYTTNGDNPTASSTQYTSAIEVSETMTIKAIAVKAGMANSAVAEATYTMNIPVINAENVNLAYDATAGSIAYTMTNPVDGGVLTAAITGGNEGTWLTLGDVSGEAVALTCSANDGDADRSATVTLTYTYNTDKTVTKVVTVTQAHFVVDYATLPFNWAGGASADFLALTGCSASSLSSDYAAGNAPYLIKFDADGKYLQVKTDSRPEQVTIGVKMIGGSNDSKITVKASADGETFDEGEELTISGVQNDIVNLETTRSFDANVRYIKMVFTKGSNVGVGPISITKYVPKYAVNLNQPQQGQGTIAADKTEAAEGETVTLTATPNPGYVFDSWTVLDGGAHEVIVTNNAFVMPASAVEVEGTFTALDKHNIVIPAAIENNVIVDATGNQAYATETVTITVEAPANQVLATLTVTGNTSSNNITIAPAVSPYVDEYTFTMPDEDVTINATFDDAPSFTVSFSVNGTVDDNLAVSVTQGQSTALPTSSTLTPEGFSITGWAASNGSAEAVADPYTPTADITLYAILGQTIPHSLVINASTPNFPTEYGTANTFTEYNLGGKNFKIQQGYVNGSKLQWRAAGHSNGTGTMYNSEDLGKINTIILVYDESDTKKNFTIIAGTTENPTEGTSIEPSTNGLVYTFDLSQGNYNYFVMTNGENAGYLQSIAIDYVADLNVNTVTTLNSTQTYSDNIPATTCVIIENNAVVTFTGTNNGTADNLIIQEGGQLVTENDVQATLQKEVTAYTAKSGDGWYLIASPVEPLAASVVTQGTYDLFTYDEEHAYWYSNTGTGAPFTELHRGKGYLYANASDVDLNYAGTMKATNSNINVDLSYTESLSTNVRGFNLVGNPFTRNIKLGDMELNGATLTQFYVMNAARTGLQSIDNASYEIKPGEGFFVQATLENQQLTFNPTSKGLEDIKFIKIVAGNGNSTDNAYINLSCGNTLRKMNIANLTSVYVMDGDDDYAAARIEDLAGTMPIHFEAVADGEYTITIEAKYTDAHYMHLLDNFTGDDIDLLVEPSYTFNATTNDDADRFRLVFDCNNYTGVEENYTSEIFAYQNGSDIYVNGNGELQIFDVMGRMVATQHINGVQTINVKLQGVYIFRLNGNTQKIVVR